MIGELSGIGAALCWALATFFYDQGIHVMSPNALNFVKSIFSTSLIFGLCCFNLGNLFSHDFVTYFILVMSGIVGIAYGDLFWFQSVKNVGPRVTLLFELLVPFVTYGFALIVYPQPISISVLIGIILTTYGIYLVMLDKERQGNNHEVQDPESYQIELQNLSQERRSSLSLRDSYHKLNQQNQQVDQNSENQLRESLQQKQNTQDINNENQQNNLSQIELALKFLIQCKFSILFVFLQTIGAIMVNYTFQLNQKIDVLHATLIRFVGSTVVVAIQYKAQQQQDALYFGLNKKEFSVLNAAFVTECLIGHNLQQLTLKHLRPEIGQTLLSLAPMMSLGIDKCLGKTIGAYAYLGTISAIAGVWIMINFH